MLTILYINEQVADLCKPHENAISDVLKGNYTNGDRPEVLVNEPDYLLCSMRDSLKVRVLYLAIKDLPGQSPEDTLNIIVEYDHRHKLNNKYFRKNVFKHFLDSNKDYFIEQIANQKHLENPAQADKFPEVKVRYRAPVWMGDECIVLDDSQLKIIPGGVVRGFPGTGKTVSLFNMLLKFQEEKILLLAKSPALVAYLKGVYAQSEDYEQHKNNIDIFTYDELIQTLEPDTLWHFDAEETFHQWFGQFIKSANQKKSGKYFADKAREVYEEFRIICAYEGEGYLSEGVKRTVFKEKNERTWVLAAYKDWSKFSDGKNYPEFKSIRIEDNDPRMYSLVLVDEGQDFFSESAEKFVQLI